MSIAAVHQAKHVEEFVDACRALVEGSRHARLHLDRLAPLAPLVQAAKPVSWDWYLRMKDQSFADTLFDLAFNAALNGGYFKSNADGSVQQWAVNGSGSVALVQWIDQIRADGLFPGRDLHGEDEILEKLAPRVKGQPHALRRLQICAEFADESRRTRLAAIAADLDGRRKDGIQFTLADVDGLTRLFPAAFGEDPFRKKAILVFTMLTGFLESRGETVSHRLPIPSDYQIPRILAWAGAIDLSDEFKDLLRGDRLIDVASAKVDHFRAAAVVCAHELGALAGRHDGIVDGALFTGFRKNPDFLRDSLPPMRCDSIWF